jgi:hypothetical protein
LLTVIWEVGVNLSKSDENSLQPALSELMLGLHPAQPFFCLPY